MSALDVIDAVEVAGGGFDSVREAYDALGPDAYYQTHGSDYRNPHELVLTEALTRALAALEGIGLIDAEREWRVFDYACGSGEGTQAVLQWARDPDYCRQPPQLTAADPYTFAAFERRMQLPCERWSFEDVAAGVLEDVQPFDVCLATFCLHLVKDSYLHTTLAALARACNVLVVATPHKRPHITPAMGWEEALPETVHERVRIRIYRSTHRLPRDCADLTAAATAAAARAAAAREQATVPAAARTAAATTFAAAASDTSTAEAPAPVAPPRMPARACVDVEDLTEEIATMNLGALRKALTERGLGSTGKRAELASRLLEARVKEEEEEGEEEDEEGEENDPYP